MGNTITAYDKHSRDDEGRKSAREAIEAVNREAAERWDDPQWHKDMAQELTETILEGFQFENMLGLLAEVENAPFNGRVFIREVRGLKAFWVARGGYIEVSTLRSNVMEIPRDTIGFHVMEFEDKLTTNFAENQATLVRLGIERLQADVNKRVLASFQSAIPSGSDYFLTSAGLDLNQLNLAIREIRDTSRTQEVAIIGRSTMTEQIGDELLGGTNNGAGFIPETNEELVRRGVIGNYRGARIITLTNFLDEDDEPFFPANELYVLARDASKFAWWGTMLAKEFVEDDNWYWHYIARRDFGGVVHRPDRIRRIEDSSITP